MKLFHPTILLFGLSITAAAFAQQTAGLNEIITVLPDNIQLEAKLDTGAATSSIDAEDIEFFTKDNQEWVRFKVDRTLDKKIHTLEYQVERHVRIVARSPAEDANASSNYRRPVIKMDLCIGNAEKVVEVNLTNRENFKYPFLVGASTLAEFGLIVDASSANIINQQCAAKKETPITTE